MTLFMQVDLPKLRAHLDQEMATKNWLAAYEQARAITAHFERRTDPTIEEQQVYLDALVAELKALSYLPHRRIRDTIWIVKRARSAYDRLRRSADAGSVQLASGRRAFWRAVIPFA